MNYQKVYNQLINRARHRITEGYVEKHHIVPRCLGGTEDKGNIVALTPEEHYVAHQLLVKIHPASDALVYAARMMAVNGTGQTRTNKVYGWLKKRYNKICRSRVGDLNPSYGRGWYHNPTTKESSKFLIGDVPAGWIKGRVTKDSDPGHELQKRKCSKCGEIDCLRPKICQNGQRIKRFVESFDFDSSTIGTSRFYDEYDRVVQQLTTDYQIDKLSVEQIRQKYNIVLNETVRCILRALNIERRSLSEAVKNFCR